MKYSTGSTINKIMKRHLLLDFYLSLKCLDISIQKKKDRIRGPTECCLIPVVRRQKNQRLEPIFRLAILFVNFLDAIAPEKKLTINATRPIY